MSRTLKRVGGSSRAESMFIIAEHSIADDVVSGGCVRGDAESDPGLKSCMSSLRWDWVLRPAHPVVWRSGIFQSVWEQT